MRIIKDDCGYTFVPETYKIFERPILDGDKTEVSATYYKFNHWFKANKYEIFAAHTAYIYCYNAEEIAIAIHKLLRL